MHLTRTALQLICGSIFFILFLGSARAEYEPNDNYSTFVISFQSAKLSTPVCIGGECHDLLAGPAILYAKQIVPNLALGLSGSQLISSGRSSSIKAGAVSAFAELLAGLGPRADVGASIAALSNQTEYCTTIPNACNSYSDNGTNLGVFGKVFLAEKRALSLTLSYNSIYYQQSSNQSIIGLTLVSILAKHHRLALSVDRVRDAGGNSISEGYGLSYSYLLYY